MSYKLQKPYTDIQRADFVCEHQGLNYYEDDNCIIMYLNTEKIVDGEAIDISKTPEYIEDKAKKELILKNNEIILQIEELEKKKIRAITDFILYDNNKYLVEYEKQIEDLRGQLNG